MSPWRMAELWRPQLLTSGVFTNGKHVSTCLGMGESSMRDNEGDTSRVYIKDLVLSQLSLLSSSSQL